MRPYFEEDGIVIYHGDCREIMPQLSPVDLVITDPPYLGLKGGTKINNPGVCQPGKATTTVGTPWGEDISPLTDAWDLCRYGMFVFCSCHRAHIIPQLIGFNPISLVTWYKRNSMPSVNNVPQYESEFIWAFKKAPGLDWKKLRGMYDIPMLQAGCMARERFTHDGSAVHPTQKPLALISALLKIGGDSVLDPYMGTGTTLDAAKRSGVKAIGIETEERYCEIAAKRLAQSVLPLEVA